MATHRILSAIALASACLVLASCGDAGGDGARREPSSASDAPDAGPDGAPAVPTQSPEDVGTLVERALAARSDRPAEFAALISAAGQACGDPDAARRLGQVAVIAARWSSAVLEGRPKAQAVTEGQLDTIDWDALVSACIAE